MIYEHRAYYIMPGKMAEFIEAFGRTPARLFEKYGAKVIGVWQVNIGRSNQVIYILAYDDLAHRQRVWQQLDADPDMQRYRAEPVRVDHIVAQFMTPVAYSALQ